LVGAALAQVLTVIIWNGSSLLVIYKLYRIQPFSHHYVAIFLAALGCVTLVYPIIWLAGDQYPGLIIGLVPVATALTVAMLLKFRLLDVDSQTIASEFWARTRGRLLPVQAHLFDIFK
jgi:O-antigen/teichoic acid export membrane protein